jgi:hypothetical protein
LCPSRPSTIQFQSLDDVTVGSAATINISNINMSGGMEDSNRQDQDEYANTSGNNKASVESAPKPKGQQFVDIQALSNNKHLRAKKKCKQHNHLMKTPRPLQPIRQLQLMHWPRPTPMATTMNNAPSFTNNPQGSSTQQGIQQSDMNASPLGFDLSSLTTKIASTISASVKEELEKKEKEGRRYQESFRDGSII